MPGDHWLPPYPQNRCSWEHRGGGPLSSEVNNKSGLEAIIALVIHGPTSEQNRVALASHVCNGTALNVRPKPMLRDINLLLSDSFCLLFSKESMHVKFWSPLWFEMVPPTADVAYYSRQDL